MLILVPQTFRLLVRTHLRRLDQNLTPALTQITWSSLNVDSFLNRVEKSIKDLETFIKDVSFKYKFFFQVKISSHRKC